MTSLSVLEQDLQEDSKVVSKLSGTMEEEQCAAIVEEIVKLRHDYGMSQAEFAELTGIKQPVIARTETGATMPNMRTILTLLLSLGKTLYIGDLKDVSVQRGRGSCPQTAGGDPQTGTDECAGDAAADVVVSVAQTDDPAGSI